MGAEKPLIGADRYEEIIEARGRRGSSVASGPRSVGSVQGSMTNLFQPNSTMAMREETRQTSMSKASSRQGSINKLNQILSNQNELNEGSNLTPSSSSVITPSSPAKPSTPVAPVVRTPVKPKGNFVVKEAPNKIAPTLPVSKFEPKQIEPSIDPL